MKENPVLKEDSGGQAKWKWVIVVAAVLTLAAGAWLFAMPKKQPPVQAKAPVRAKIQAAVLPVAGTAAPTQADAAEQELEVADEETGETSALTEADEETPAALSAGAAGGAQTTAAQETPEHPVAELSAADKEAESKPAPTALPANTSAPTPKPMLATAPDQTAKPLPPVREESSAPPPAPSVAAPAPEKMAPVAAQQAPYTIQVGAFRNKSNADRMFKVLNGLGYNPFIFKLDSEGKDPLYMVRFGGFADRDDATAALNAFKQKENMAAVVARSGQI